MSFGSALRRARRQQGRYGWWVAEQVGIDHVRYSRIENGHVAPKPEELEKLERVLGPISDGESEGG